LNPNSAIVSALLLPLRPSACKLCGAAAAACGRMFPAPPPPDSIFSGLEKEAKGSRSAISCLDSFCFCRMQASAEREGEHDGGGDDDGDEEEEAEEAEEAEEEEEDGDVGGCAAEEKKENWCGSFLAMAEDAEQIKLG
jgi:hypothetical protein